MDDCTEMTDGNLPIYNMPAFEGIVGIEESWRVLGLLRDTVDPMPNGLDTMPSHGTMSTFPTPDTMTTETPPRLLAAESNYENAFAPMLFPMVVWPHPELYQPDAQYLPEMPLPHQPISYSPDFGSYTWEFPATVAMTPELPRPSVIAHTSDYANSDHSVIEPNGNVESEPMENNVASSPATTCSTTDNDNNDVMGTPERTLVDNLQHVGFDQLLIYLSILEADNVALQQLLEEKQALHFSLQRKLRTLKNKEDVDNNVSSHRQEYHSQQVVDCDQECLFRINDKFVSTIVDVEDQDHHMSN